MPKQMTAYERALHSWKCKRAWAARKDTVFDLPEPRPEDFTDGVERVRTAEIEVGGDGKTVDTGESANRSGPVVPSPASDRAKIPTIAVGRMHQARDARERLWDAMEAAERNGEFGQNDDGSNVTFWQHVITSGKAHPNLVSSVLGRLVPQQVQDVIQLGELKTVLRVMIEAITLFVKDADTVDKILAHLRHALDGPRFGQMAAEFTQPKDVLAS